MEIQEADPTGVVRSNMWNRILWDWKPCWGLELTRRQAKRQYMNEHGYKTATDVFLDECIDEDYTAKGCGSVDLDDIRGMEFDMVCIDECISVPKKVEQVMTFFSQPLAPKQFGPEYYAATNPVNQEKENNMGEYNMEVDQRNHLKRRAETLRTEKLQDLRGKFHIGEDPEFKTKDEILAALKAGNIEFNDYFFQKDGRLKDMYLPDGTFCLKNPKTDKAGYEAAEKLLNKAYMDTKDAIIIDPLPEAKKALQAFEAQQF